MRDLTDDEAAVLALLSQKPLRLVDIQYRTGIEARAIQKAIEDLRHDGMAAICSGGAGYWTPRSVQEYAENVDGRRRRAIHQMETCRGERALLRRWYGQLAIKWPEPERVA
jgi:biotin operon repressor